MEYIQCPLCLKKYGVNDKIRGASGKTIRCKGCQGLFEITVFSTPSPQTSPEKNSETTEKEHPATTVEYVEKKGEERAQKRPGRKSSKNLLQIMITSMLGVVLIIALVVAYQFLDNPLPIEASQTETSQTEAVAQTEERQLENRQPEAKQAETSKNKPPVEKKNGQLAEAPQNDKEIEQQEKVTPEPATSDLLADSRYQGPSNPTDECKQAATSQWFTDYMITNGSMTGKEYIRLLDESSGHTEEVLKLCKDKYLVSRITEAARLGKSPSWIEAEIEARTSSRYENEADKEIKW